MMEFHKDYLTAWHCCPTGACIWRKLSEWNLAALETIAVGGVQNDATCMNENLWCSVKVCMKCIAILMGLIYNCSSDVPYSSLIGILRLTYIAKYWIVYHCTNLNRTDFQY